MAPLLFGAALAVLVVVALWVFVVRAPRRVQRVSTTRRTERTERFREAHRRAVRLQRSAGNGPIRATQEYRL